MSYNLESRPLPFLSESQNWEVVSRELSSGGFGSGERVQPLPACLPSLGACSVKRAGELEKSLELSSGTCSFYKGQISQREKQRCWREALGCPAVSWTEGHWCAAVAKAACICTLSPSLVAL